MARDGESLAPSSSSSTAARPSSIQRRWLRRGLDQAGGKLPLFDRGGQRINERTVRSCIENGWAEPWFSNPLKPNWLVCKLTSVGRDAVAVAESGDEDDAAPEPMPMPTHPAGHA